MIIIIVVVLLIIFIVIPVIIMGVLYVWVSDLENIEEYGVEIIPLDAKDAEQDVDDVMFYLKHTGGDPLDLDDYTLKAGPSGNECDVSFTYDVRSMSGRYQSTWSNETHTLSVNNRVYLSPGCLSNSEVNSGDQILLILINKDSMKVVWEKKLTVYDS